MTELIPVRFLKDSPPYATGEVAGFEEKLATRLVDRKTAEWLNPPEEAVVSEAVVEGDPDEEAEADADEVQEDEDPTSSAVEAKRLRAAERRARNKKEGK